MPDLKAETLNLAGFIAAHAAWSISGGETLIPLGGANTAEGAKSLNRFFDNDLGASVAMAKEWLEKNPGGAACAAIAFDGYLTIGERIDAIVLEVRSYAEPLVSLNIYVPYRPAKPAKLLGLLGRKQDLIIYRPKFANMAGFEEGDSDRLGEAFFSGIDEHERVRPFWFAHYDPSK